MEVRAAFFLIPWPANSNPHRRIFGEGKTWQYNKMKLLLLKYANRRAGFLPGGGTVCALLHRCLRYVDRSLLLGLICLFYLRILSSNMFRWISCALTPPRIEIIADVDRQGRNWSSYEFHYRPQYEKWSKSVEQFADDVYDIRSVSIT